MLTQIREGLHATFQTKSGLAGSSLLLISLLLWAIRAGSDVQLLSDTWPIIKDALLGWGPLVGLLTAGFLIAKAIYDTRGTPAGHGGEDNPSETTLISVEPRKPRDLTPYEIEERLKAIKAASELIGDETKPTLIEGRYLISIDKELRVLSEPDFCTSYQGAIAVYSNRLRENEDKLRNLRRKLSAYPDIQSTLDKSHHDLIRALNDYIIVMRTISDHVAKNIPKANLAHLTGVATMPIGNAIEQSVNWCSRSEASLAQMRREMAP